MARTLELNKVISSVVIDNKQINFEKTENINVLFVTDTGNEVNAMISFVDGPGETHYIELWGEKNYNATWDDDDVDTRIKEILNL